MYRIQAGLQQQGWETLLRAEANVKDIFSDLEGVYSDEDKSLPNAITVNVALKAGEHKRTLPFLKDLSNTGVEGQTPQLGNETDQATKFCTVFSNDLSNAVNTEKYGIDAFDKKAYNILGTVQPQLSKWHKQRKGKYFRQALLQRYASNLTVSPIGLTQGWNENVLVKNVDFASQPVYSNTLNTYTQNIANAMAAAGTSQAAQWDVSFFNSIVLWASGGYDSSRIIEPITIGGRDCWVVCVPARQAALLRNPQYANSIAGLQVDSNMQTVFKQYIGNYGPLILVEDPLAPVLALTGSSGSYVLTPSYKDVGNVDARTAATGTLFDVGYILGKGAVAVATHEGMHFEEELTNYGKISGVGAFTGYGIQTLSYDDDSPSATSRKQPGSGVLLTYRGSMIA